MLFFSQAGETVRPSEQNKSLQSLEDASDRIQPCDAPREPDQIETEILGAQNEEFPQMVVLHMSTLEERTKHEVDHIPYAAWCWSYVAGKGTADGCVLKTSDDSGVITAR